MYEGDENNFDAAPPEETSNRTFLLAAGILGFIVLLSLACIAGYVLVVRPQQLKQQQDTVNAQATQNAKIGQALTATFQAQIVPTATQPPTQTPVLAQATSTATLLPPSQDPATATVAAALTQAALAQQTVIPTSSALPGTGIADEYGMPGLVVLAMVLLVIILLARRIRLAPGGNP
jgi:hypothetical protein